VLTPGGRYAISHAAHGPSGEPYYPLPWAKERSYSFLGTREEILELVASVGFKKIECRNETSEGVDQRPGELSPGAIMGADMPERQANAARSAKEGRLVRMFVIAQRPQDPR
jgi:sarcosine/dimethylglycine N-methyltransferase